MKKYGYFSSKIGIIEIVVENDAIIGVCFVDQPRNENCQTDMIIANCIEQLTKYFAQKLTSFNLPIALSGTPFQELVWSKTYGIPYGTTITYGQLAAKIGAPKAMRAVGSALGKNPLAIIIPCHRVVGKNAQLINYRYGVECKKSLLMLEKK